MPARTRWRLVFSLLTASALVRVRPADAHGTYPDAQQILLPADRPDQIILGTNFGLILSDDGGKTWLFSCEHGVSTYAGPYLLAALPAHRIFSITASAGLIYSDDDGCTWNAAGGAITGVVPYAFSPDPSNDQRVYVIGAPLSDLRAGDSIYVSDDGGSSFGPAVYTAPAGGTLLTVSPVAGQPGTVFAAMYSSDMHPVLLASRDSGESWDVVADLVDSLGQNPFELLWIDSADPSRLYVRILGASGEILGISKDGGKTVVPSVSIPGKLIAFLKLSSGTILVGGTAGSAPVGYRSTDNAETFTPWPQAPRVHALAERNGKLYVGGSNYDDGYAIAESDDEGATLKPLAAFAQVSAMKSCVAAMCADSCSYYAGVGLWSQTVCGQRDPSGPTMDAGADGADAGTDSSTQSDANAADFDAAPDGPNPRGSGGGCGCDVSRDPPEPWTGLLLLGSIWIRSRRRARLQPGR